MLRIVAVGSTVWSAVVDRGAVATHSTAKRDHRCGIDGSTASRGLSTVHQMARFDQKTPLRRRLGINQSMISGNKSVGDERWSPVAATHHVSIAEQLAGIDALAVKTGVETCMPRSAVDGA